MGGCLLVRALLEPQSFLLGVWWPPVHRGKAGRRAHDSSGPHPSLLVVWGETVWLVGWGGHPQEALGAELQCPALSRPAPAWGGRSLRAGLLGCGVWPGQRRPLVLSREASWD